MTVLRFLYLQTQLMVAIFTFIPLSHASPLETVNAEINRLPYVSDRKNFGAPDDWRGLGYFYRHGGDCEDFALAKMSRLKALGYEDLRLILGYTDEGTAHALLRVKENDRFWYLDNRFDEILSTPVNFRSLGK